LDGLSLELRKTAQVTEYGTRNAAVMHALLAALEFLGTIGWEKIYDRQRELSSRLIDGLQQISGVELLTTTETTCYGGIVTFRVQGFSAAHISASLLQNFKIRTRAITEHHLEACRISLHIFNSPEEVDTLIGAVEEIASSVR